MTREDAIETRIGRILALGDVPALMEHVNQLTARLASPEATVQDATVVLRNDVGLALRVIRTANSASFNRSGIPIMSLHRAAALIGLETLKEMTVRLSSQVNPRYKTPIIRPVMAASLLTAIQSRAAAQHLRHPRLDEAYLCGLLRSLGEVLVCACFAPDYLEILSLRKEAQLSLSTAAQRVIRCTFEDIGRAAAKAWNLPQPVVSTMNTDLLLTAEPRTDNDRLRNAVAFGHEVTDVMHRWGDGGQSTQMSRLTRLFAIPLKMKPADIQRICDQALLEATPEFTSIGVTGKTLLASAQLRMRDQFPMDHPAPPENRPEPARESEITRLESKLSKPGWDFHTTLREALALGRQAGSFDRALFFLLSSDRSALIARLGFGEGTEGLLDRFRIELNRNHGPAAAAILARRDLVSSDGSTPIRNWVEDRAPACFAVYPIVIGKVLAGCLYFDRQRTGGQMSSAETLTMIKNLVSRIIADRHASARPA